MGNGKGQRTAKAGDGGKGREERRKEEGEPPRVGSHPMFEILKNTMVRFSGPPCILMQRSRETTFAIVIFKIGCQLQGSAPGPR